MKSPLALIALSSLALAGCASPVPTPEETFVQPPLPTASPVEESLELGAVLPEVMLIITATARAADGALLQLEQRVNLAVPLGDVGAGSVPTVLIESCPGILDSATATSGRWTFTRVVYSAISPEESPAWQDGSRVSILPSTQFAPIASMSFLSEKPGATLPCQQEKFVAGEGRGAISMGSSNDALEFADGGYLRWSELNYGFVTTGTDVTLSDCTFELTPLGSERGGGNPSTWGDINDAQNCVIGARTPVSQF